MSAWRLTLKAAPALRVDLRGITPDTLSGMALADVEKLPVGHGNRLVPLAEFFRVESSETPGASADGSQRGADAGGSIVFDGDLSRFDRIGWQMTSGHIDVNGHAGHYAGGCMRGGSLTVKGNAGLLAACEMAGGRMAVTGDVGDFAAGTLPGSMDGMRGGSFVVEGHAGARFGDRMRRGTALVFGNAGDFLASRMVAGTIAIGGSAGAHAGYGMRRGSVVFAGAVPEASPTFVPAIASADVFWQLLARDLASHGGPFEGLAGRRIDRYLGDLSAGGKGEVIFVR